MFALLAALRVGRVDHRGRAARAQHRALLTATLDDAIAGLLPTDPDLSDAAAARDRRRRSLARVALTPFARRFSHEVEAADALAGRLGLAAAGRLILDAYAGELRVHNAAAVPARGPLLVVANHPGTVDAPALMVALARRPDLRIIALDRPFLRALHGVGRHLLYVGPASGDRGSLLRMAADHLRGGGSLLSFPAGHIEPDPALHPEAAAASLSAWSRSTELLARLVPGTAVVPAAVSGVLSMKALGSRRVRRLRPEDRELGAAIWQLVRHDRSITPQVRFGGPLPMPTKASVIAGAMAELLPHPSAVAATARHYALGRTERP